MRLDMCNWPLWQSIWPVERKGVLNVYSSLGWEEKNVEIRGNALFIYPPHETQCVNGICYLLEYSQAQIQVFTPQNSHKLPSVADVNKNPDGVLLKLNIANIEEDIQFYIPEPEAAELWKDCLDKASITRLKRLVTQQSSEHQNEVKKLKEEVKEYRILKDESLYGLSSAEAERDKLQHERDKMESDSFVAKTSATVIYGMQVELCKSLNRRIKELREGLDSALQAIRSKDMEIKHLKSKLEEYKSLNQTLKDKLKATNDKLNEIALSLHETSVAPENKGAYLAFIVGKNHDLKEANKKLTNEVAKVTSRFFNIRNRILNEFNDCIDSISFEEAFEFMKAWIICSELKIAYYDTLITGDPDKSLYSRLEAAQRDFMEMEIRVKAYYVIHRSRLLNVIIDSDSDSTMLQVTKISKEYLSRLEWLLGENQESREISKKSIEPPIIIMHSAEKELHRKSIEINRLEDENNSLRTEVKRLSSLVGGPVHWDSILKLNKI